MTTTANSAQLPLSSQGLSQENLSQQEDPEPEDEDHGELFGRIHGDLVGIRYYSGVAHPGEMVHLVREPNNPYDRNAVRCDNLNGQKVGHIKREQAYALSLVMDQHPNVTIDAIIPRAGNSFKLPVQIDFIGTNPAQIKQVLASRSVRIQELMPDGRSKPLQDNRQKATAATAPSATVQVSKKRLDWKAQSAKLDEMFEEQSKAQLEALPEIDFGKLPLTSQLFEHQKTGIRWLAYKESGAAAVPFYRKVSEGGKTMWLSDLTHSSQAVEPRPVRGGILADEMGLGKTLQTLGLILAHPPPGTDYAAAAQKYADQQEAAAAAVASSQLEEQAEATAESTKPLLVKPTKTSIKKVKAPLLLQILRDHNVALTSTKKDTLVKACADALQSNALTVEQYYAGLEKPLIATTPKKTAASAHRPTMIVCPVSVASNWMEQVEGHVAPGTLRLALYAGPNREELLSQLDHVDVVVVSYNTLAHDFTKYFQQGAKGSGEPAVKKVKRETIFDRLFHRICLDEAHTIRNTKTRNYKAVMKIQATCKICLTGTPMQNTPADIMSLFSFLGVEPLHQADVFRRAITQPIMGGDMAGLDRLRAMMAYVALRRTKAAANLKMADKSVELRSVEFPPGLHKDIHDALFQSARGAFAATLGSGDDGSALKNYTSIFEVLLRIRQACCSGAMVPKERWERAMAVVKQLENRENGKSLTPEEGAALLSSLKGAFATEDDCECAVCLCEMEESAAVILRTCSHVYCQPCISRVAAGGNGKCPLCRADFESADMIKKTAAAEAVQKQAAEIAATAGTQELGVSPKVSALLEAIKEMKPDEKGIIFSQFTSFLDEIETSLKEHDLTFTRIDGSMSAPKRIQAMRAFSGEDDGPRLILCSLKAAGTGVNLTRGNHVFMMDTWWNKAVEDQAQDRAHRIGQTRNVRICRFVMATSIEERMLSLQEAKAAIGKGAMQKLKPEEARKARLGMFRRIFDLPLASEEAVVEQGEAAAAMEEN